MDILRFINSRDVRDHLKNINYKLSPLESAWLVWQCKSATLEEKYAAWNEIIDTMPDCEVPERTNCRGWDSLHEFLREHMRVTDKYLQLFFEDTEDAVYRVYERYLDRSVKGEYPYKFEEMFDCESPFFSNLKALRDKLSAHDCVGIERLQIEKQWLDCGKMITVEMTPTGAVVDVEPNRFYNKEDEDILITGFPGMYFLIPVPFKKGDILCPYYFNDGYSQYGFHGLCVYEYCILDLEGKLRDSYYKDYTDMALYGIFQDENGNVFFESDCCYLDYEYHKGELKDVKGILKAISRYFNGKMDLSTLLESYHTMLIENTSKTDEWEMDKALTEKYD